MNLPYKFRDLLSQWKNIYALRSNVRYGKKVHVGFGSFIESPHGLIIGNDVYIGKYTLIGIDGQIGNNVVIANSCGLVGRYDHDFTKVGATIRKSPWVGDFCYNGPGKGLKLIIQDDVWVGFGSIILSGIEVGRGSIIGAGSVVTKNVQPYTVVAGNPARVIGKRFSEAEVKEHELLIYGKIITKSINEQI